MPRKARIQSKTGVYHIMLRGANRQEIFHDDEDCIRFLETIQRYKSKSGIQVFAWCLMGNHVHLLLKEGIEDISNTMRRIGISFVSYYHWKYKTTGHLFQDRFRSENVESDRYLLTVTRYIHQNPIMAGLTRNVDEWKWSSCQGYYGKQYFPMGLLDKDFVLEKFSDNAEAARRMFRDYNELQNDDQCLDDFPRRVRKTDTEAKKEMEILLGPVEIAHVKSLPRLKRNEILRNVKKIEGVSYRQIARIFGVSPSLVARA